MLGASCWQDNLTSVSPTEFLHSLFYFSKTFLSLIAKTKFACKINFAETVYSFVYGILLSNAVVVVELKAVEEDEILVI